MNRLTILGVIGLVLLCVFCTFCRAPAIEEDVRAAALACAEEVGLEPEMISVSSRDVTLAGYVASEDLSHHLTSCITAFPGTRLINNQLEVLGAGALGFQTHYGDITISGVVPTAEAQTAIIDQAVTLWGAANVTNALEIDPGRSIGGWSDDDFANFLAILHHSRRDLDIELSNGQAIVGGTVLSELARIRVLGGAVALLPGFEVVDRLTAREPTTPRETLQASLDNQLDGKVVEFEIDKANLTSDGRRVLNSVIVILRANPGRVEISGHTDTTGPMDHNLELSQRRAETVQSYFVAKGFKADRFEIVGHGPTRPIASNAAPAGQQMNRRTEFHALKED
jgi:outer membrane protein OmpA-like peptidoglycan-associated protein/osmotically-inducible protein OsmY